VPVDRYSPMSFMFLIAAHVRLDNLEQARTAAELAVARYQLVGMENAQRFLPFAEQADRAELLADLSEMF